MNNSLRQMNMKWFQRKPVIMVLVMGLGLFSVKAAEADPRPSSFGAKDRGEFVLSAFTGLWLPENNDLRLRQSGGADLTFHNVSYQGRDFSSPPYYGARLTYFLPEQSHWGFGAEFFHAKLYLGTGDTVHVTGTRGGAAVNDNEVVGNTIQSFILHNGMNFATADVFYRWQLGRRGEDFLGRF